MRGLVAQCLGPPTYFERARAVECGFTIEVCNERLTARYSALIKTDINLNYI